MKHLIILCLSLLLLNMVPIGTLQAQSPNDNLCNPGGVWETFCVDSNWWTAGWFGARLLDGRLSVNFLAIPPEIFNIFISTGLLNDIAGEDNLCNRPNSNCNNEWSWRAGWYVIRVEDGRLRRDQVPADLQFALPPELPPAAGGTAISPTSVCYAHTTPALNTSLLLVGTNATIYNTSRTCTGNIQATRTVVEAPDMTAAAALCASVTGGALPNANGPLPYPASLFTCF